MPLLTLFLWVKNKIAGSSQFHPSDEDKRCITEILLMEEVLFQQNDHAVRWPIIQLYRNLLVAVLNTFILNSMYRSLVLLPVFLLFIVHDSFRKPFKHVYLNHLQILTSVCLQMINMCNVLPSMSIIFDVMVVWAMEDVLRASKYLELVLLAIVPLSLPVWKLWEKVQDRQEKKKE